MSSAFQITTLRSGRTLFRIGEAIATFGAGKECRQSKRNTLSHFARTKY
jgi:hypothetical protein